jgi:hypothetical protein
MAPLVVLRDGRKREFTLLPEGIACDISIDRYQRPRAGVNPRAARP